MTSYLATISNPKVSIRPSSNLKKYLSDVIVQDDTPASIKSFIFKNPDSSKTTGHDLVPNDDKELIESVTLTNETHISLKLITELKPLNSNERLLTLSDIHWLQGYIQKKKKENGHNLYLHELLEDSAIILPKNDEVPRREELELRCSKFKAQQENREYVKMTKNVDSIKKHYPEDTLSYQMKQMNRSLLVILQFIVSVVTGFMFGCIGIELLIGSLDFGFRLLLGIISALTVALAELYFLSKTLDEELKLETETY